MQNNNKAIVYGSIAVLSWSTVATSFKIALSHFNYFEMLLIACFSALFVFAIAMTIQKKWKLIKNISQKQWLWFGLIGFLNPVVYYLLLFKAYELLPAQIAQPVNYCWPIILLVLLALFARQSIPKAKYIGMALSLTGVTVISLGSGQVSGHSLSLTGITLTILSACLWATYWIVNRLHHTTDNTVVLFAGFLFGSIYLLIASCFIETHLNSLPGMLSASYIGLFEMGIPFLCFSLAIKKTNNPALINQMCYLAPFISLLFIHLILKEQIYTTTYIGLILIITGIIFNEYLAKSFNKFLFPRNNIFREKT